MEVGIVEVGSRRAAVCGLLYMVGGGLLEIRKLYHQMWRDVVHNTCGELRQLVSV